VTLHSSFNIFIVYDIFEYSTKSSLIVKDTKILERVENIAQLPEDKKKELFNVLDAYLRDFKTRQAYS